MFNKKRIKEIRSQKVERIVLYNDLQNNIMNMGGTKMIEKYLMSEKTLDILIRETGGNTYKGCPVEIDDSIPYGGVDPIEKEVKRGGISIDALTPFNIDHSGTDDIVCPYCGYKYQDGDDIRDVSEPFDLGMIECDNCNNTFTGEIEHYVRFYTKKVK